MLRPVLFLHRWLGVLIGLLMTIWCLSGFVMMYSDYPQLSTAEQVRGLEPLKPQLMAGAAPLGIPAETALSSPRVEMMAGRPVLRIRPVSSPERPTPRGSDLPAAFDLSSGRPFGGANEADLAAIAAAFGRQSGVKAPVTSLVQTGMDQWTVQTYRRNAPLYRADFGDGTQIYIAGPSGEVVQASTRSERFWGWLGAVPHWLYPTILRRDGALWNQVVVWTSLIGCFLTVTGLWVGIVRLRRKRDGSVGSPFQGIWWWHHIFGLFFGILTLTWVASGLFSMNPWGFLDSAAGLAEREKLAGPMRWAELSRSLDGMNALPGGTVRLEAAPLNGRLHWAAVGADGHAVRLDASGRPAPLARDELTRALAWAPGVASLELMRREDAYYYAHRNPAPLPVWRAILADAQRTRLYIDTETGRLIRAFDGPGRSYRWLMTGLHDLDFPILRVRPLWDLVVLPLLAAVTAVCATGAWMGLQKIRRDLRRLRNRRKRPQRAPAAA